MTFLPYALDFAFQSTARSGMRERLHSYALAYANSDFARDGRRGECKRSKRDKQRTHGSPLKKT